MAKVEINESVVEVEHEATKKEGEDGEKKKTEKTPQAVNIDVDTLVDICVERVFELLKANYDR